MASFQKLCEESRSNGRDFWDKGPKNDAELDERAKDIILRGLEIRPDRSDGETFWDDFMTVFGNNSEAASSLLGVSVSSISRWSHKIRKALEEVRKENDQTDKRKTMLPTGQR